QRLNYAAYVLLVCPVPCRGDLRRSARDALHAVDRIYHDRIQGSRSRAADASVPRTADMKSTIGYVPSRARDAAPACETQAIPHMAVGVQNLAANQLVEARRHPGTFLVIHSAGDRRATKEIAQ